MTILGPTIRMVGPKGDKSHFQKSKIKLFAIFLIKNFRNVFKMFSAARVMFNHLDFLPVQKMMFHIIT